MSNHISNQIQNCHLKTDSTLHVIGVISNPVRYHSRYRLYKKWEQAMLSTPNVKLYTVEAAFGDRHHEITSCDNPNHLQLRTNQEIWIKENMINIGVRDLFPSNWKYMAWVDCDVFFRNDNWALETLHQLQHSPVLQPWQHCLDLGYSGQVMQTFNSFGFQDQLGVPKQRNATEYYYQYAHSGYAWAAKRSFWENTKGLMDFGILGSGDHHMAWAMINEVDSSIHKGMTDSYFRRCHEWQQQAVKVTQKHVGFTPGRIEHEFHGPKKRRYYRERWQILVENKFDPDKDLFYDDQGLLRLHGKPALQHAIKLYNRSRFEDSIEDV